MSSMLITQEDFERMRSAMDNDGDGRVTKEEFKVAYKLVYRGSDAEFHETYEFVWKKIDRDGDGNLTVDELAAFYGFSEDGSGEMTDDQILNALAMAAEMEIKMGAGAKSTAKEEVKKKILKVRDNTIRTVQLDKKTILGDKTVPGKTENLTDEAVKDMVTLLELLSGAMENDLKSDKEDKETVFSLLEKPHVLARIEDHNGEMPLHKLARFVVADVADDKTKEKWKLVYHKLVKKMRDECKELKRPLVDDINKQDSKGKTPMFQAIQSKNLVMIEMLNELEGSSRPDSLIVTAAGWSVLHEAVQTDDFAIVKEVVKGLQKDGGRIKVLINLKDKTGRQPLHIAAYRCHDESIINFLMENGANGEARDHGGMSAPILAQKANRSKSKELIEEGIRRNSHEFMGEGRGPRHSKEMLEALGGGEAERARRRSISSDLPIIPMEQLEAA